MRPESVSLLDIANLQTAATKLSARRTTNGDERALPNFAPRSDFARALQIRLRRYTATQPNGRIADGRQWRHAGCALAIGGAAMASLLTVGASAGWLTFFGLSAVIGLSAFMLLVQIGHDAAHGSVSRKRWINDAAVFLTFAILGVSGALWKDRHLRLHHPYPNVPGTGIDADSSNIVRMAPDKAHRGHHRFQMVFAPFLFALGTIILTWVEDMVMFADARRTRPRQFGGVKPLAAFVATKLFHVALFIALPLAAGLGAVELAVFYVASTAVTSMAFAILVIGTHVSDHAAFPVADAEGNLPYDWATLQLVTSVDWSPTNARAAAWTGGANAHTAHHLLPGYAHSHAPALAQIVIDAAADAGVPYRAVSFSDMVMGQVRHIWKLGRH